MKKASSTTTENQPIEFKGKKVISNSGISWLELLLASLTHGLRAKRHSICIGLFACELWQICTLSGNKLTQQQASLPPGGRARAPEKLIARTTIPLVFGLESSWKELLAWVIRGSNPRSHKRGVTVITGDVIMTIIIMIITSLLEGYGTHSKTRDARSELILTAGLECCVGKWPLELSCWKIITLWSSFSPALKLTLKLQFLN